MNSRQLPLRLLAALPLVLLPIGLAAKAAPSGVWTRIPGAPDHMATWSMVYLDALGQGSPQLYSVTHAGPAYGWTWEDGAFRALEQTPWGEIKGDRHAVTPCDIDRDGDLDLIQAWGGGKGGGGEGARVLLREGEGYERVFIPGTTALRMRGASCLDVDFDGTVEVYLPGHGTSAADQLYSVAFSAQGGLDFVERSQQFGLARGESTYGGLFGDLDSDGDLDLLRLQEGAAVLLLQQDGRFVEAPWQPDQKRVRDIALDDVNGDGHLDILLGRAGYFGDAAGDGGAFLRLDSGDSDSLVWRVPEQCTMVRAEANGTFAGKPALITLPDGSRDKRVYLRMDQSALETQPEQNQGLLLWTTPELGLLHLSAQGVKGRVQLGVDCPKEGGLRPELVHADIDTRKPMEVADRLYLGDGQGGFTEHPLPPEIAALETQDLLLLDVDLDGDLDLFIVSENAPGTYDNQPDMLLLNDGAGGFSPAPGFPTEGPQEDLYGHTVLPLDLSGDRYPELLVSNGEYLGPLAGTPALWLNPGGSNHWLQVDARDADGHPALHARVTVIAGGRKQTRSSNPFPDFRNHSAGVATTFGLGDASRAKVIVEWPDGSRRVKRFVTADQVLTVEHP